MLSLFASSSPTCRACSFGRNIDGVGISTCRGQMPTMKSRHNMRCGGVAPSSFVSRGADGSMVGSQEISCSHSHRRVRCREIDDTLTTPKTCRPPFPAFIDTYMRPMRTFMIGELHNLVSGRNHQFPLSLKKA